MADRYLRMSHWVYEALFTLPMSKDELRVMMLIVKYTVGFHRYECDMSARFAAQSLGISFQHANKCINSLKAKGYISIIIPGSGQHPAKISFNYRKFSVAFRECQRRILEQSSSHFDDISVIPTATKKRKETKNKQIKNKQRFASESDSLFSNDEPEIEEQEFDPEADLSDEEWMRLHSQDEDDE